LRAQLLHGRKTQELKLRHESGALFADGCGALAEALRNRVLKPSARACRARRAHLERRRPLEYPARPQSSAPWTTFLTRASSRCAEIGMLWPKRSHAQRRHLRETTHRLWRHEGFGQLCARAVLFCFFMRHARFNYLFFLFATPRGSEDNPPWPMFPSAILQGLSQGGPSHALRVLEVVDLPSMLASLSPLAAAAAAP
jgi:hypothetical protein